VLLSRGEFSLILATLAIGAGLDDRVAPFIALDVLVLTLVGPVLAARSGWLALVLPNRLVGGGFRDVGQETMVRGCPHVDVGPAPRARTPATSASPWATPGCARARA
jgi:CPA2 family monovalent cation:H+ antiporter-2